MKNLFFTIFTFAILMVSCTDDETVNEDGLKEFTVDISGTWSIINATQDGEDITNSFDFNPLNLEIIYDGDSPSSYALSGAAGVPFALRSLSGDIVFDDLTYPTELFFLGDENVTFNIVDPIVSKGGFMKLSVSLGCASNTYIYSLSKN